MLSNMPGLPLQPPNRSGINRIGSGDIGLRLTLERLLPPMGRRRRARLWKAIEEVFSRGTRHQRCWVHKTANVLNKVALSVQLNMKSDRLIDLVTQSPP